MTHSIANGNVYDVGQTINGVSRFVHLNGKWHYFEDRISREYEYDQNGLTHVVNVGLNDEVTFLGNIFDQFKTETTKTETPENPMVQSDEWEFVYYKRGTAGSFRTALYDLYWRADFVNQLKLESAFPQLWVLKKYQQEPGYWEDLQERVHRLS